MSETLFKILIDELGLVRLKCRQGECRGLVEVPLAELCVVRTVACPLCGYAFLKANGAEIPPLTKLARAVRELAQDERGVDVEFVLPAKE